MNPLIFRWEKPVFALGIEASVWAFGRAERHQKRVRKARRGLVMVNNQTT